MMRSDNRVRVHLQVLLTVGRELEDELAHLARHGSHQLGPHALVLHPGQMLMGREDDLLHIDLLDELPSLPLANGQGPDLLLGQLANTRHGDLPPCRRKV
jgi:hypothetical protein